MKYLTILLLILCSCCKPTPDNRPLITQKFVVFYPNHSDTLTFESKDVIIVAPNRGDSYIRDSKTYYHYFESTAPIKKLK